MDPLLKCLLDLCWHVAFLFYQVRTWNWTLLLVIYNVDTLCRDKQEGILRNELNAFLFFFRKTQFLANTRKCVKNFLQRKTPSRKSYLWWYTPKHGEILGKDPGSGSLFTNPRKNAGFIRWNIPPSPAAVRVNLVSQSLLFIWKLYIFLCQ